jgi:hypothetical protein
VGASKNRRKTGNKGSFKPGDKRINKKGRPPLTEEQKDFKALCRLKAPDALERLEKIGKRTQLAALNAAATANKTIIEHAWGKPKQELDITSDVKMPTLYLPEKAPE